MQRLEFEIDRETALQVTQALGDLAVKGGDFDSVELVIDGEPTDVVVERQGNVLSVTAQASLAVHLPDLAVQIGQVNGDLILLNLNREVRVEQVLGDCTARQCAAGLIISRVNGELVVEHVAGPVTVSQVLGDMRIIEAGDAVTVGTVNDDVRVHGAAADIKFVSVHGDLRAHDVVGRLMGEQVNGSFKGSNLIGGMAINTLGDLVLKSVLTPGKTYTGKAQGDISVRVPVNASARFTLRAGGGISTRLLQIEEKEAGCVEGKMGNGEATVVLEAGGHLSLKPGEEWSGERGGFEFDIGEGLAAQIRAQVARQFEGTDWSGLAQEEVERMISKIERKVARAQERAQEVARQAEEQARRAREKAQRAQERAQQAAERAARRIEMQARRWGDIPGFEASTSTQAERKRSQVSPEEQLRILQMLQEGKITVEEAEMLLKALEG